MKNTNGKPKTMPTLTTLVTLKRKRLKVDLDESKGKLVSRDKVNRAWRRRVTEAKVQIESIPALVASFMPEGPERVEVHEKVKKLIDGKLRWLAGAMDAFEGIAAAKGKGKTSR
jgi:hypothetical protein